MSTVEPEGPNDLGGPDPSASAFDRSSSDFDRGPADFERGATDDMSRSPEYVPTPAERQPHTRTPDPTSIAAGVVFFLLGGAYLLAASGHLTVNAAWTISLLFIGLGLSGVLGAALAGRRRR